MAEMELSPSDIGTSHMYSSFFHTKLAQMPVLPGDLAFMEAQWDRNYNLVKKHIKVGHRGQGGEAEIWEVECTTSS